MGLAVFYSQMVPFDAKYAECVCVCGFFLKQVCFQLHWTPHSLSER